MVSRNFNDPMECDEYIGRICKEHKEALILQARRVCRGNRVDNQVLLKQLILTMRKNAEQVYEGYDLKEKGVAYLLDLLEKTHQEILHNQESTLV